MTPSGIEPATFWLVAHCKCVGSVKQYDYVNPNSSLTLLTTSYSALLIEKLRVTKYGYSGLMKSK
jgi:hypothetical protein